MTREAMTQSHQTGGELKNSYFKRLAEITVRTWKKKLI